MKPPYIADQAPDKLLAPANRSVSRYQLQSRLRFIGTELHKGFGPLFKPTTPSDYKRRVQAPGDRPTAHAPELGERAVARPH